MITLREALESDCSIVGVLVDGVRYPRDEALALYGDRPVIETWDRDGCE